MAPVSRSGGIFRTLPTALKAEQPPHRPPISVSVGRDTLRRRRHPGINTHRNEHTVLIPRQPRPVSRAANRRGSPINTHMSSNYSSNNRGRSRSGGGGRRRSSGSRGPSGRSGGQRDDRRPQQPAKKKGFFAVLNKPHVWYAGIESGIEKNKLQVMEEGQRFVLQKVSHTYLNDNGDLVVNAGFGCTPEIIKAGNFDIFFEETVTTTVVTRTTTSRPAVVNGKLIA